MIDQWVQLSREPLIRLRKPKKYFIFDLFILWSVCALSHAYPPTNFLKDVQFLFFINWSPFSGHLHLNIRFLHTMWFIFLVLSRYSLSSHEAMPFDSSFFPLPGRVLVSDHFKTDVTRIEMIGLLLLIIVLFRFFVVFTCTCMGKPAKERLETKVGDHFFLTGALFGIQLFSSISLFYFTCRYAVFFLSLLPPNNRLATQIGFRH